MKRLRNKYIRIGISRAVSLLIVVLLVMMLPLAVLAATERQSPDAYVTQTNLDGTITDIQDDPDSPDANWADAIDEGANVVAHVSFPTPSGDPTQGAGLQEFKIWVRKVATGGGTPTVTISLYENGAPISSGATQDVTNLTGALYTYTWDASSLSNADGSGVELYIDGLKVGGGPNARSIDVGAVEWNVDYTDTVAPTYTVAANSVHAGGDTVVLTFDEPMNTATITDVLLQADTNITLDYSDDAGDTNAVNIVVTTATVAWTVGDTVATITLDEATDGAYIPDLKYVGVTLVSVTDVAGNPEAGAEIYTSAGVGKETGAPTATLSPVDGASSVGINDDLVLSFDETVNEVASGVITIHKYSDNSVFESFTITDGKVTGTGTATITINPAGTFASGTRYYVLIDATSFEDLVGNAYAGIALKDTWDFTTAAAPSIINDPTSFAFGTLAEGGTYETTGGLTTAYFTVTNNSAYAVNITIGGTDMTGGNTWTLSNDGTAGNMIYGLNAGLQGGSYSVVVRRDAAYNELVGSLGGGGGTQDWGLQLLAPTTFTDGVSKSGMVTLTATQV